MNGTNTLSQEQIVYFLHPHEKQGFGILGKMDVIPNPGQPAQTTGELKYKLLGS